MSRPDNPLVSVIIPTYNRRFTVVRAVESVLAQTWKNIEVIVVDDGSKDDTLKVLEPFGSRIQVISQQNQGQSVARNTGIAASKGDIISFLDSDDTWLPEKTEKQARLLVATGDKGTVCSICNASMRYTSGLERTSFGQAALEPKMTSGIWLNPAEVLLTRFLLFNQVVDVWRDALDKAGYFRADLRHHEDYELELRLALMGPWAFNSEALAIWYGSDAPSESKNASAAAHCDAIVKIISELRASEKWGSLMPAPQIRHRLTLLKLQSATHRLADQKSLGSQVTHKLMEKLTKVSNAIYRRSPWIPQMEIKSTTA